MNINFGERIKLLRKKRRLNQSELAKILGVSRVMISSYESDMRKPSYENLISIVMYFNVSMDWMFGNAGDKEPQLLDLSKLENEQAAVIQDIARTYEQRNGYKAAMLDFSLSCLRITNSLWMNIKRYTGRICSQIRK